MTPKQLEAIRRHGEQLLAIFPNATERDPVKLCKKLRQLEVAAHRHAERMCSDADYSNEWMENSDDEQTPPQLAAVCRLLDSERPWYNSDPRGYAFKVDLGEKECSTCSGVGMEIGTPDEPCGTCYGKGLISERLHTDLGGYGILAPEIGPEGR